MRHFTYLAVLAFIFLGSAWLEVALRTRVFRRWKRLLLSLAVPLLVFLAWDAWAILTGYWSIDPDSTIGVGIGPLPLEELIFFLVVPLASILSLEAVRAARGWPAGDEGPTRT